MDLMHVMAMCQLDKVRAHSPVMCVGLALGVPVKFYLSALSFLLT